MKGGWYAIVAMSCATTAASAQSPSQVAIIGCRNAAAKEVRALRPEADSVRFMPNPAVTDRSDREKNVRGSAQYFHGSRREWRPFMYECVYNTRSAATSVQLRLDDSIGT